MASERLVPPAPVQKDLLLLFATYLSDSIAFKGTKLQEPLDKA